MRIALALAVLVVAGLTAVVVHAWPDSTAPCTAEPVATIPTMGGPEDLVALRLADGRARVFVREPCRGFRCDATSGQISFVDFAPAERLRKDAIPTGTTRAWRPPDGPFEPLGLSLVPGAKAGDGTLYVLDLTPRSKDQPADAPKIQPRIWRLDIVDGSIRAPAAPWSDRLDKRFKAANDLQAVGDAAYVTRYDFLGWLPGRGPGWPGLMRVHASGTTTELADGFRGANGIIDLPEGRDLVVSDYWNRRLRFVAKASGEVRGFATDVLPIHPDNLTLDGTRILIAGQRSMVLTALNLALPFAPSPSAVLSIRVDELGEKAMPRLQWDGASIHGRSVSVAVPLPRGLVLGQIRTPGVLVVDCPE